MSDLISNKKAQKHRLTEFDDYCKTSTLGIQGRSISKIENGSRPRLKTWKVTIKIIAIIAAGSIFSTLIITNPLLSGLGCIGMRTAVQYILLNKKDKKYLAKHLPSTFATNVIGLMAINFISNKVSKNQEKQKLTNTAILKNYKNTKFDAKEEQKVKGWKVTAKIIITIAAGTIVAIALATTPVLSFIGSVSASILTHMIILNKDEQVYLLKNFPSLFMTSAIGLIIISFISNKTVKIPSISSSYFQK